MSFIYLLAVMLFISACGTSQATPTPPAGIATEVRGPAGVLGIFPHQHVGRFEGLDLKEPSGIIFHAGRGTLFVIGDRGHLTELQTDGTKVKQERLTKKDVEAITYNPATGYLYVAVEEDSRILEVDPEKFKVIQEIFVERSFEEKELLSPSSNKGFEGIAFVPDESRAGGGTIFLANQSDELEGSIVVEIEILGPPNPPIAQIINYFPVQVSDLSDLYYDHSHDRLLMISDDNNVLLHLSRTGKVLDSYALPGGHQEGITLDGAGFLYIAEEADDLIAKFKWNEER